MPPSVSTSHGIFATCKFWKALRVIIEKSQVLGSGDACTTGPGRREALEAGTQARQQGYHREGNLQRLTWTISSEEAMGRKGVRAEDGYFVWQERKY